MIVPPVRNWANSIRRKGICLDIAMWEDELLILQLTMFFLQLITILWKILDRFINRNLVMWVRCIYIWKRERVREKNWNELRKFLRKPIYIYLFTVPFAGLLKYQTCCVSIPWSRSRKQWLLSSCDKVWQTIINLLSCDKQK